MEVINDLLNYNNLKIIQNSEWFSFSLDSVLLADFAGTRNNIKIIDFCTGNAPIPLFLSTKTNSKIIGVEIQKEIYDLAIKNILINNLCNQIDIINEDVLNLSNKYDSNSFDLITCNPPYFKINEGSKINDNDILVVHTQTDAYGCTYPSGTYISDTWEMTPNTITEQCFDIVTIEKYKVTFTRIGAGNDRIFNYN